jgi:long-chain acyl-CoA synthetase
MNVNDKVCSALRARGLLTPPFALWLMLADAARRSPDGVWFRKQAQTVSYGQGLAAARRLAHALHSRGIGNGDRVAICMPNDPIFGVAAHAAWLLGASVAPVHPAYAATMQHKQLQLVEPAAIVTIGEPLLMKRVGELARATGISTVLSCDSELAPADAEPTDDRSLISRPDLANGELLSEQRFVDDPHLALLQFTGGTTGAPKAAMLTHRAVSINLGQIALALERLQPDTERALALAPFSHVVGINGIMNLMTYFRSTLLIEPVMQLDQILTACATHAVTYVGGPPTLFAGLAGSTAAGAGSFAKLKYAMSGGAPLPSDVKARFEAATGSTLLSGYGMTEASCMVCATRENEPFSSGSSGRPADATTIEIVAHDGTDRLLGSGEVGEVCIRGPQIMEGYWRNAAETATTLRNGRVHSGDLGRMVDGQLFVVDRLKDIIIASGYNIYPTSVEEALYQHPAVREAAAVGYADSYRGESVAAVVALRAGAALTLEDLQMFLKDKLSPMEIPKRLEILESLPKSPAGKVLRREIRDRLATAR